MEPLPVFWRKRNKAYFATTKGEIIIKPINIGFGNVVIAGRIIAIISPESAPVKRIIQDARDKGTLVDATYGRRTRAVIITDSDHVILSSLQPETLAGRVSSKDAPDIGIDLQADNL